MTGLSLALANLKPGDTFRAWTAGCSTGEEAYSVALLMADVIGEDLSQFDVKIYATDIDEDALMIARRGEYTPGKLRHDSSRTVDGWALR